jgi:hypothetical protein
MRLLLFSLLLVSCITAYPQSKTTEELHKKFPDSRSFFFYNNTLRMLNQTDDKEFDELIKDIEKLKFLYIDKSITSAADYKKIVSSYKEESFEAIMNSRFEGKTFDVFLKEEKGKTKGMIVTVNDSGSFFVLDTVGSIALNRIQQFFKKIDESSEVTKLISDFTKK